jgi:6-pyruvoyltetrahydropterin/6-carboxytetrahydropterin synthase
MFLPGVLERKKWTPFGIAKPTVAAPRPVASCPMPLAYLTRKTRFASAHRYWRTEWSAERNERTFGACANPHGHGHNYVLEVMIAADIDPQTGFSANMPVLDAILNEQVVRVFDHQHINHAIAEFGEGGMIPTSENILVYCWSRIAQSLPETMKLHRLRLREDETFFVDYYGGEAVL